jgi:hypothetical protein
MDEIRRGQTPVTGVSDFRNPGCRDSLYGD